MICVKNRVAHKLDCTVYIYTLISHECQKRDCWLNDDVSRVLKDLSDNFCVVSAHEMRVEARRLFVFVVVVVVVVSPISGHIRRFSSSSSGSSSSEGKSPPRGWSRLFLLVRNVAVPLFHEKSFDVVLYILHFGHRFRPQFRIADVAWDDDDI